MNGTPTRQMPSLTDSATKRMHALYRQLHSAPELSMQEHETAELIEQRLTSLGIPTFRCGRTGVVGILESGSPGPVVAYRADIDALPLAEQTGLDFASSRTGLLPDGTTVPVMHACGHDAHTTVALTLAELFSTHREHWRGTIVLVFQPGEEIAAGAQAMIDDGLWQRAPLPEVLLGQHIGPAPAGSILYGEGVVMATADSLRVTVNGRGAHASRPSESIDPILLAAHMIVRLQGIVSREIAPQRSAVVTVATISGGLKENIIPSTVEFSVNVRTFDQDVRERVLSAITRIVIAEAQASGAPEPRIERTNAFPACLNDPRSTRRVAAALCAALGEHNVRESEPFMGSEDVGNLSNAIDVPLVYWLFGGQPASASSSAKSQPGNHSPEFAPAYEPALATGVRAGTAALLEWLAAER